jgi:hypothetical protein
MSAAAGFKELEAEAMPAHLSRLIGKLCASRACACCEQLFARTMLVFY